MTRLVAGELKQKRPFTSPEHEVLLGLQIVGCPRSSSEC